MPVFFKLVESLFILFIYLVTPIQRRVILLRSEYWFSVTFINEWITFTSSFRVSYQTIEFGSTDIHIRTLRDKQEYSDPEGAEQVGLMFLPLLVNLI